MLNLKNTIENLGLILVSITFGTILGGTVVIRAYKSQHHIIEKAIEKETTQIVNEIRKIKTVKGKTDVDISSSIQDSTKSKKRWFRKRK